MNGASHITVAFQRKHLGARIVPFSTMTIASESKSQILSHAASLYAQNADKY